MKSKELQKLQAEIKTFEDNWKRALADYQNLVKRVESDKKDFIRFASANIVAKFIPTLDVLEMAAIHTHDPGVQMAVKQFQEVLKSEGLQEINPPPGESFNHELHECIETVPGSPNDTIAELVLKGYKIEAFIIRPAKVKVLSSSKN